MQYLSKTSRSVLIVNHLEPTTGLIQQLNQLGQTYNSYLFELSRYISDVDYDLIIFTRFNGDTLDIDYHAPLLDVLDFDYECYAYYPYWQIDQEFESHLDRDTLIALLNNGTALISGRGETFIAGNTHSEIVLVPDWLTRLSDDRVDIAGCYGNASNHCHGSLANLETVLNYLNISYTRIDDLIV